MPLSSEAPLGLWFISELRFRKVSMSVCECGCVRDPCVKIHENMAVGLCVQACLRKQGTQNPCVLRYNGTFKVSLTVTLGGALILHCQRRDKPTATEPTFLDLGSLVSTHAPAWMALTDVRPSNPKWKTTPFRKCDLLLLHGVAFSALAAFLSALK